MKRYLGILIALTLLLSLPIGVYGENNVTASPIKLDLEQAYKLLEANNLEIKLLDKKIQMKIQQNEDLRESIDNIRGTNSINPSTNLQYRKTEKLSWRQATLELEALYNEKTEKLNSLKTSVKQQYVSLLLQKENIEYLKKDIEVMTKRLQETELRIKMGQVKDTEYKLLYSQSLSLENQLNSLNTQYETSMINLKKVLGLELIQPIEVQNMVLPDVSINDKEIQTDIAKAIDKNFSVAKLNDQIEMKKLEIQLIKEYTDAKFSTEYRDLQIELSELDAELKYQRLSIEAEMWIEYYNLSVLQDKIKLEELNLEIAKLNYEASAAKAKLGLINSVTEINASIAYNRQKNTMQSVKYDYIISAEQFNQKLSKN